MAKLLGGLLHLTVWIAEISQFVAVVGIAILIQKVAIQVRPPVEHRDKVDELAQTISEIPSVSPVRQKEPLTATR
jgi:hypothetical protein